MKTTMKTVSLHYMVRMLKATYSQVIAAFHALGLRGRVINGERVWTADEAEQIRIHLAK